MSEDEMTTLRLTSATFSGRDRVEAFRETYGRTIMQLDIEPMADHPLELDFTIRGFSGFGIARGSLSPTHNTHTVDMISDDDVVLVVTPQGHGSLRQNGREVAIRDGEATFVSNGSPGIFLGHVHSHLCNFRFSRAMLASMSVDIDSALVRPIPRDNAALRLLTRYASIVNDEAALATAELRRAVALHMHDLAALVAGATQDARHVVSARGVRAARLRAIKDDIQNNLTDRSLSAGMMAARHGVSSRYVSMLFEFEGLSFSEFVLAQRLARAHLMLSDPRLRAYPISAIAYDVGFGDLSYFNRSFRKAYAMTPSDVRESACRP
ncbi:AraC family transcriptional regulator [Microbacteriaceae bacterium K1510]|nr:AraC family transcriptional regulator [Microbacteriaceae bacterium K1510]